MEEQLLDLDTQVYILQIQIKDLELKVKFILDKVLKTTEETIVLLDQLKQVLNNGT